MSQKDSIASTDKFPKLTYNYDSVFLIHNISELKPGLSHGQPDQWLKLAIGDLKWIGRIILS